MSRGYEASNTGMILCIGLCHEGVFSLVSFKICNISIWLGFIFTMWSVYTDSVVSSSNKTKTPIVYIGGMMTACKDKEIGHENLWCTPYNTAHNQNLFPADTPDAPRKLAVSTQSLASGTTGPNQGGVQPLSQRKRLLRAPTLAELDSSESDVRCLTLVGSDHKMILDPVPV